MEYRFRLAKAKEEEDNSPAASIHIQNLTRQENTRALFRRIRYMERKIHNLSTSRLTVTRKEGKDKEISTKNKIEAYIISANKKKYHQTEGQGQLQKGQLLREVGVMGTGPQSDKILNGTYYPPPGTSEVAMSFLKVMKRPENFRPIPPPSYHDFCVGWKKAKECTSSNGPHFGHYKAAIENPRIGQLLYKRSIMPLLTGYSPRRHRNVVDVMLLKKEQNSHMDSLRTIVLFDSEANMNAAIQLGTIATEQYSRPQQKSIDHAVNRRLVMDHQFYCRQPYAFASCNLKSCYDRINHTSASLSLQRIGISKTEVMAMLQTIQQMSHRVRTAFGDSLKLYGGFCKKRWRLPPQGVLQGNGSGPAIWSILSSNLFQILQDKGHQNVFQSSIRRLILELAGFAYVDDTDLVQVDNYIETVVQKCNEKLIYGMNQLQLREASYHRQNAGGTQ